jgi:hypothetical protein
MFTNAILLASVVAMDIDSRALNVAYCIIKALTYTHAQTLVFFIVHYSKLTFFSRRLLFYFIFSFARSV